MDRIIKRTCAEVFDIAVILAGMRTFVRVPATSQEQAEMLAQKNGFTLAERVAK